MHNFVRFEWIELGALTSLQVQSVDFIYIPLSCIHLLIKCTNTVIICSDIRSTFEMKTCPIERPRSTTPINPSCLEEYCEEVLGNINVENITKTIEKLKIILPRDDHAQRHSKTTSPRKTPSNPTWTAFAEKGISPQRRSSQEGALQRRPSQVGMYTVKLKRCNFHIL